MTTNNYISLYKYKTRIFALMFLMQPIRKYLLRVQGIIGAFERECLDKSSNKEWGG
ncbi:MAG TPA: hypothetical protein VF556_17755 [Pyrinomonadaceae bacterium]